MTDHHDLSRARECVTVRECQLRHTGPSPTPTHESRIQRTMTTKVGDASEGETDEYLHRRAILEPAILNVVNALGGYEGGVYRLGDEAYGCLKDLKRFWRKDDADDARTVARILWAARVLPNDLVPILLETAGKGHIEDKRALACADLIAAMTWPIDIAEELKELDELQDEHDPSAGAEYTELRQSHLHYKAALLQPGVLRALLALAVPCLARASASGRNGAAERDAQVVSVVLHVVRNLAFIADAPANVHLSADQAELASLQSRLVRALSEAHFLELLLAAAAGAQGDAMFNASNTLLLEIFYLLFRGIRPSSLVSEQAEVRSSLFFSFFFSSYANDSKRNRICDSCLRSKASAVEISHVMRLHVIRVSGPPSRCG
jgi:replication fork protection complex subunit Tof1/Swi1